MKNVFILIVFLIMLPSCTSEKNIPRQDQHPELTIFSIHSNIWERNWQDVFKIFEEKNECQIDFTLFSNSLEMLQAITQLPQVDIVIGLDNINYLTQELDSLFLSYEPLGYEDINKAMIFAENYTLIPIAYGDLSFIINQEEISDPPYTFGIMQDGIFKRKLLFPDPRKSSLGKAFLLWSIAAFGENGYGHFWRSIKANIHSTTNNWDESYNMFLAGEAPIVLGYSTIPYYHQLHDSLQVYRSLIPSEGGFRLIEAAGIFYQTDQPELSRKLIDFLVSATYQSSLLETRWIKPVTAIELTDRISQFPRQENDLTNKLKTERVKRNFAKWLNRWVKLTVR